MKKRVLALLLCVVMVAALAAGCSANTGSESPAQASSTESAAPPASEAAGEEPADEAAGEEPADESDAAPETAAEEPADDSGAAAAVSVAPATLEQVQAVLSGDDANTLLVDARPQEAYTGWALEGAANGGHLKNALLFSARWLDCDYSGAAAREVYLERALADQGITKDKEVIVYDYTGNQAAAVAGYLAGQGVEKVSVFQADELIDAGTDVETYANYDRFIPTEIVKSISDVKTGKEQALSEEAKALVGEDAGKVVLVDVGWGNAKTSSYFSAGHVPGAVHINTDSYERPRVYVPEKRSDYAKEWRLISLEEFRDEVCPQYGITKDSIVIMSGKSTTPQARLGFMLRSLGVKAYAMSGALMAWTYNGYALDTDESTLVVPESVDSFGASTIANPNEILWMDDIKAFLNGDAEGQVVDNRGEDEWNGEYSGYGYHDLSGQIEGSIWCSQGNDEDGEFFDNVDGTPRTQAELAAYLESSGLDTAKTMAFFCGDSWGAAKIAYWCQSVDLNNVKEWGNGWIPWSNEGNAFIDHNGNKVHYDKYLDAVIDSDGNDVSDGTNILGDEEKQ